MNSSLDFWALQYASNNQYPYDIDFYLKEASYWDLELFGEKRGDYCDPNAIIRNQKFSTNDGLPLQLTNWRHPKWVPNGGGVIPAGFVAQTYKVIIYNDQNRTSVTETITGNIDINDQYLIDKQGWFISKILDVTQSNTFNLNIKVDIFCDILQPSNYRLIIILQKDQNPPVNLYDQYITDQLRTNFITFSYIFNELGIYTIRYRLITYQGSYIQNWCYPSSDYEESNQSIIEIISS